MIKVAEREYDCFMRVDSNTLATSGCQSMTLTESATDGRINLHSADLIIGGMVLLGYK